MNHEKRLEEDGNNREKENLASINNRKDVYILLKL